MMKGSIAVVRRLFIKEATSDNMINALADEVEDLFDAKFESNIVRQIRTKGYDPDWASDEPSENYLKLKDALIKAMVKDLLANMKMDS